MLKMLADALNLIFLYLYKVSCFFLPLNLLRVIRSGRPESVHLFSRESFILQVLEPIDELFIF